jgi:hypothetical protein
LLPSPNTSSSKAAPIVILKPSTSSSETKPIVILNLFQDDEAERICTSLTQITLSTAATPSHIRKMTYTDPRSYLYQPGLLDPDAAQRITRDALKACDDGELYLQYSATESFGFDDGRLKMADYSTGSGFGLRGVSG